MEKTRLAEMIINELEKNNPGDVFKTTEVFKNGKNKFAIMKELPNNPEISPLIYVDDIHREMFENGNTFGEVISMINDAFSVEMPDTSILKILESGKRPPDETLTCRVLSKNVIKEKAADFAIKDVAGDLALVLDVREEAPDGGEFRVMLPKDYCKGNEDNLFDAATKNLKGEMTLEQLDQNMYVVSNKNSTYGAAVLFGDGVADDIARTIGDFYALPSSVHEFIVIPKSSETDIEKLKAIVKDANSSIVSADEVLSDNVYAFSDGKISVV